MNRHTMTGWFWRFLAAAVFLAGLAPVLASAQQIYKTEQAAADALVNAISRNDKAALGKVLGANWRRFIPTQDIDKEDIDNFLAAWSKSNRIVKPSPDKALLEVGDQGWTFPIPIVKRKTGWQFDLRAGADEMRTRRIGRNEMGAMQAMLAYFDAQKEYASADRMGDGVLQYAQKFDSSPGKRDGLYWPVAAGEEESPLGPLVADIKPGEGYYGYRYKILKGQGKDAPGGAYSYLINNRMVSGFAMIAWPVRYGDTGVMSFMVSHDGQVYQKDLGPKTAELAKKITTFNPGSGWERVEVPVPVAATATSGGQQMQ